MIFFDLTHLLSYARSFQGTPEGRGSGTFNMPKNCIFHIIINYLSSIYHPAFAFSKHNFLINLRSFHLRGIGVSLAE